MTAIQAALGISQMKRLEKFILKRNKIASIYEKELPKNIFKFQKINQKDRSSRHLFIVYVKNNLRNKLYNYLIKNKIQTNLHYIPVYRHPFYAKFKINKNFFFNSEEYYAKALSLPIHFNLTTRQQKYIIDKINFFFKYK
jgi:dTDP-4-amino-4,6-dideoxygalactose transaminase